MRTRCEPVEGERPPLAATLEQLNRASPRINLQLGEPMTAGWSSSRELIASGSPRLRTLLAGMRGPAQSRLGRHRAGLGMLAAYDFQVVVLAVGSYLAAERMPDIRPDNVWVHFDAHGWGDALCLGSAGFVALPGDPHAAHPDAEVVADREVLRDVCRRRLEEHMQGAIQVVHALTGIGRRALWASLADRIVEVLIEGCRALGQEERCDQEVAALVQVPGSPLKGRSGLAWIDHDGRPRPSLQRGVCCLDYSVPGNAYCANCPIRVKTQAAERRPSRPAAADGQA
jgi:ferric iron reductase protein FhuF